MTFGAQLWACANSQGSLACDTFIDRPPHSPTGLFWSHFTLGADANKTTYVFSKACEPVTFEGGIRMLKCTGLNTTSPASAHETYDLSYSLVEGACLEKGCHAFTVHNDNSSGTLFTFAAAAPNASSYLLLT